MAVFTYSVAILFILHPAATFANVASDRAAPLARHSAVGGRSNLRNISEPKIFVWAGFACSSYSSTVAKNNISGPFSTSFNNLICLATLYLESNQLSGPITDLNIPTLVQFNVSDHQLTIPIPKGFAIKNPQSSFEGNPLYRQPLKDLCDNGVGHGGKKKQLPGGAISGTIIGSMVGLLLILLIPFFLGRKRGSKAAASEAEEGGVKETEIQIRREKKWMDGVERSQGPSVSHGNNKTSNVPMLYLIAVNLLLIIPSDGRYLRPSDHGLAFQDGSANPTTTKGNATEMASFFNGGGRTVSLPEAKNLSGSDGGAGEAWWRNRERRMSHEAHKGQVREILLITSLVCGLSGVVLLVVSAFMFVYRYRMTRRQGRQQAQVPPPQQQLGGVEWSKHRSLSVHTGTSSLG